VISPVDPTDDYDFTIYNLTGVSCTGNIDVTTRIRSNGNTIVGSNALVGLDMVSLEDFVRGGTVQHNFLRAIQASVGDVYYILIDNFINTSVSGFSIDFAGSTATFKGKTQPVYDGVTSICDSNTRH
jgi:hypothetical protein